MSFFSTSLKVGVPFPGRQVQSEIQGHKVEQDRVIGELKGEKEKMKVQMMEIQRELQYTTEALDKAKRSYTNAGMFPRLYLNRGHLMEMWLKS